MSRNGDEIVKSQLESPEKKRQYKCACCDKIWQSITHARIHLSAKKITGEPINRKPRGPNKEKNDYNCSCGKKFRSGYDLRNHQNKCKD